MAANAGSDESRRPWRISAAICCMACRAALVLTPSLLARAATPAGPVTLGPFAVPDRAAAAFDAAIAGLAAPDLAPGGADSLAGADGLAGGELGLDASAAAGTATAAAARTPATATRRMGTDMI